MKNPTRKLSLDLNFLQNTEKAKNRQTKDLYKQRLEKYFGQKSLTVDRKQALGIRSVKPKTIKNNLHKNKPKEIGRPVPASPGLNSVVHQQMANNLTDMRRGSSVVFASDYNEVQGEMQMPSHRNSLNMRERGSSFTAFAKFEKEADKQHQQ